MPKNLESAPIPLNAIENIREKLDAGTSTDKIQQMKYYLKTVDEQLKSKELKVKEQQKQVEIATKNVEIARLDYLKRHQDVEKLKLHREEWTKEIKAAMEHLENVEGDELGSAMYARKKSLHRRKKDSE